MFKNFTIICLLLISVVSFSQNRGNDANAILAEFTYAFQFPGGDLSDRFGNNINAGAGIDYIFEKSNLIIGIQGNILFGNEVKENVLGLIDGSESIIYSDGGSPAEIATRQRGFYFGAHLGKLFSLSKTNKRSGIRATLGMGLLQHKIRIQDDPQAPVAHLNDTYKKGYDRLTNGLSLTQFVGYQHMARDRRVNFFAGFEFSQAFTQNRRDFNYDTFSKDDSKRVDLLYGFRLGWVLPFFVGDNPDEIFY